MDDDDKCVTLITNLRYILLIPSMVQKTACSLQKRIKIMIGEMAIALRMEIMGTVMNG